MVPRESQPLADRADSLKLIQTSCFSNTHGRGEHGLSSFFLSGNEARAQDLPAWIAIALELLRRRVQQGDRGARSVADGEWRVAMTVGFSRVFRWPERARRSRWRAQWGSERAEWPERLPAPRLLAAPALPKA
jgi:hypothetical protein